MTQAPSNDTEGEEYFRDLRQGSVLHHNDGSADAFALFGEGCDVAAVISQTCDVVLPKRPTVVLAPVVELQGEELRVARRRDNPRYVHLPFDGEAHFADLGRVHAVDKPQLVDSAATAGIDFGGDGDVRTLSLAIGRWFSRFAFPDVVVPWLRPLLKVIREKYSKTQSPLGQVLQDIVEIRVEAQQWSAFPLELVLHVIAKAGVVPTIDDGGLGQVPQAAFGADGDVVAPGILAELIMKADSAESRASLWPLLAESMALLCRPSARELGEPGIAYAVSGVAGEFWTDDEFPLSKYRKSEQLDVDYLSAGYPL